MEGENVWGHLLWPSATRTTSCPGHQNRCTLLENALTRISLLALAIVLVLSGTSCSRLNRSDEQAKVATAFESWKSAVVAGQTDQTLAYIPSHVDDYLVTLNTGAAHNTTPGSAVSTPATIVTPPSVPPSASPCVDLFLRTALDQKVPADLRPHLTLSVLLQRISQRHLLNTRDIQQISLGHISVNGEHASAEVYYQRSLTALRLPFVNEDHVWKIDVLALLPYAEVLMRLDRAVKGETETQQVDQLVAKLPSL
jgi:hypothetical protein